METLATLAHAVTESLELSEVLDRVAHAAIELLPDSSARIWVMEGERLVLRAEHGPHGAPQSGFKGALAVGEGLTGRVAATGEVLIVDDVADDPGTINRDWMRQQGYVSFIGIPLLVVKGRLEMLGPRLPEDSTERKWIEQSLVAVARIREMVARMQRIARVQYLEGESRSLPRLFDLRRASDAEDAPGASPPPSPKSR